MTEQLRNAAKDALDYLTLLFNQGDIDGQVGGEIMSQLASALENSPASLADAHSKSPSRPAMPKEEDTHG